MPAKPSMSDSRQQPVIVGIGEVIDRDNQYEPRALLKQAAQAAGREAPAVLARVDSIDVVAMHSWRYQDIARLLAHDLGLPATRVVESDYGGEKPIRLLGEAAERIAAERTQAAIICGAEATRTLAQALRGGAAPEWQPKDPHIKSVTALDFVTAHAARYKLVQPTQVYPLYENATRHSWRQSADEADAESAELWSRYSEAAAANAYAWLRDKRSAAQIRADSPDNRLIAYPYRKLMVANPSVNQGAAILLTSLEIARECGVAADQMVYVGGGARADEPRDFLRRDRYDRSTAQDAVLRTTLSMNEKQSASDIDLFEFYSCFPTVPKMARRTLGLNAEVRPSVTGGLTFFGGPANNFMTHAIAAAVRQLRARIGHVALLYGQGEFVTKHAAIVLSDRPPPAAVEMRDVQSLADQMADPIPPLLEDYEGQASIESFTVIYDRTGAALCAPVIARTPAGERVVGLVPAEDSTAIAGLSSRTQDPIGRSGHLSRTADGSLRFAF